MKKLIFRTSLLLGMLVPISGYTIMNSKGAGLFVRTDSGLLDPGMMLLVGSALIAVGVVGRRQLKR